MSEATDSAVEEEESELSAGSRMAMILDWMVAVASGVLGCATRALRSIDGAMVGEREGRYGDDKGCAVIVVMDEFTVIRFQYPRQ